MRSLSFLFILFLLANCETRNDHNEKKRNFLITLFVLNQPGIYDSVECQKHYTLNPVYVAGGYAQRLQFDTKQYTNVALTDSTWDISRSFSGFFDQEKTQINSVSGDTLCDFNSRFRRSINTSSPQNLIVSTIGGNDFLRGFDDSIIIDTFLDFNSRLASHFPNSKKVFVQVHRTKLSHVNERVERVTPKLKERSPSVCWVDPNDCFSNPVLDSEFLPNDSIHYAKDPAFCIKAKIKAECGVEF